MQSASQLTLQNNMADPRGRTMLRTRSTTSIQQVKSANLDTQRARLIHHTHNIRTQEDLRHTALRSEFQKSSSRLDTLHLKLNEFANQNIDTGAAGVRPPVKNIPMIQTSNDRWSNFQMTSHQPVETTRPVEDGESLRRDIAKASISPLTNIRSLASTTASSTSAAPIQTPQAISLLKPSGFLQRVQTPATENRFDELESLPSLVTSAAKSQASKNRSFLSRVSSLLPFDRRQDDLAKPTEFQEVESSEENDLDDEPTQNSVFNDQQMHFSPLTTMDLGSVATVLDILSDVKMPQLKEQPKPIRGGFGATRTQQKILDLKDLAGEEKKTLSGQNYSHKIQHESVRAQWTQIRLRYLSYLVDRKNVACRAGVLGFVYRYPNLSGVDEKVEQVTWQTKDDALNQLWEAALAILDPAKGAELSEDSDVYGTTKVLLASAREALLHRAARATHLPKVVAGMPELGQDLELAPGV